MFIFPLPRRTNQAEAAAEYNDSIRRNHFPGKSANSAGWTKSAVRTKLKKTGRERKGGGVMWERGKKVVVGN